MSKIFKIFVLALLPILVFAKNDDYDQVVATIKSEFVKVIDEYKAGNVEQAVATVQNAYFGYFEDIEAGIRINFSQKKAYAMEKQFGEIRKAIKAGEAPEKVQERIDNLNKEIDEILPKISSGHRLVGEYSTDPSAALAEQNFDVSKFAPEWKVVFEKISQNLKDAADSYDADKN
ncbi:MAG: FTR1 family iron permease, partial [Campylobacter sp.]